MSDILSHLHASTCACDPGKYTIQHAKFDALLLLECMCVLGLVSCMVDSDSDHNLCRFTDVSDAQGYSYDYNPCNTFKAKHCDNKEVFVRMSDL